MQDPLVGRLVDGRYSVVSRIARGGMATVYLATDTRLDREVALKVMHPHLADDEQFVARFHREAKSVARLSHPGVVAVYDQGADAGTVYLAMEHVPGQTLRDLLVTDAPLTPREALDVLEPVLDALGAAHRAGLVHRDVKPENVLLADDGRVKVADFGLARAASTAMSGTTSGMLIGTVAYLSPELVLRGVADARSDVYAAGILLFEMLTGRQPFGGDVPIQVAYQHVNSDVPAPGSVAHGLARDLDDLVLWATSRDPDDRPSDAGTFLAEVRATRGDLTPADLDRRVRVDERPTASDGRTLVVQQREHALALPVGDPEDAHDGRDPSEWGYGPGGRRRRRGVYALVGLLVAAVLLGLGGWYLTAGPGAYVTTPDVTGRTADEAERLLAERDLSAEREDVFDDVVPVGTVADTDPAPGADVRKQGTVLLRISAGPELFPMPDVVGQPRESAERTLDGAGLDVDDVVEEYSDDVPTGAIAAQSLPAQQEVRAGDTVDLTVSLGRQPIDVPGVVEQSRDDAEAAITDAGLVVGDVVEEPSLDVAADVVVRQDPEGGQLFRGDEVSLVVSSGPPLVAVPDVVTLQRDAARQVLEAAGFQVEVDEILGGFFGTVRAQDPSAGAQVPQGSTIALTVV